MADQISDAVLDAVLTDDPAGRVACETFLTTGLVVVGGEITTSARRGHPAIVRETIAGIGYTHSEYGFDADDVRRHGRASTAQSPDIAQGVDASFEAQHDASDDDPLDRVGAGDQGMMFGYACRETDELMPLPITPRPQARQAARRGAQGRGAAVPAPGRQGAGHASATRSTTTASSSRSRSSASLVSTQHADGIDAETLIKPDLIERVLLPILPAHMYDEARLEHNDFVYVNPTGRFVVGGPMGDTGLDRAEDHRRHVRRRGPSRRRRLLGQGSDEGRPLGRLRRALRGEERRRRRARRPLRAPGGVCDRRRSTVLDARECFGHRSASRWRGSRS